MAPLAVFGCLPRSLHPFPPHFFVSSPLKGSYVTSSLYPFFLAQGIPRDQCTVATGENTTDSDRGQKTISRPHLRNQQCKSVEGGRHGNRCRLGFSLCPCEMQGNLTHAGTTFNSDLLPDQCGDLVPFPKQKANMHHKSPYSFVKSLE